MQTLYHMNNKYTLAHFARFGILLLLSVGLLALDAYLGLNSWSHEEYAWVAPTLMAIAAFGIWALISFGGFLDGKKGVLKIIAAAVIGGVIAVLWLVIKDKIEARELALPFFVVDAVLMILFFRKTWAFLVNFVKGILNTTDGDGNEVQFPGRYVLDGVHSEESMSSPMGTVLINGNTVMFVLSCRKEGQVYVTPNNTIEIRKQKFLKDNETVETSLDVSSLLFDGEMGARRLIRLVEEHCAKKNIPVPVMNYNFAIFMPKFQPGNMVLNEAAFRDYGVTTLGRSYKKYVRAAGEFDLFCGKAAFNTWQLQNMMTATGTLAHSGDAPSDPAMVAEILAEACHLVPATKK